MDSFNKINPPYIKLKDNISSFMLDAVIALVPLYVMAYFYYGLRALSLGLVSAMFCYALDRFCFFLRKKRLALFDLSALITGLIVPLLCPASVSYSAVLVADMFGILAAKIAFGGTANNIFNPAAAAVCFLTISFNENMSLFPVPLEGKLSVLSNEFSGLTNSPAAILRFGGIPQIEISDMLFGNFPGPMGAVNILVILSCFIYLLMRKVIKPHGTLAFILTAFVLGGLFPRADLGFFRSGIFELFSGSILFGGVYLLNDPSTSPKRSEGKVVYGVVAAALTILFRHIGAFEQEVFFVILICNSFVGIIDYFGEIYYMKKRQKLHSQRKEEENEAPATN